VTLCLQCRYVLKRTLGLVSLVLRPHWPPKYVPLAQFHNPTKSVLEAGWYLIKTKAFVLADLL
ncbi:MAG: hypothetical protein Q4C68_07970, partial [Moraxella sp.]|nr:hypothetical protein [Moraxella sp.]